MSNVVTNNINPRSGDSISINGSVSIGGTLTYEDVTNIDSVGIITAQSGIIIGTGTSIGNPTTNELGLYTNSSERIRIDSSGRLLVGVSSASGSPKVDIVGNSASATGEGVLQVRRGSNGSATNNTLAIINFGDTISGGNARAQISASADDTGGVGDLPTRLVFATTADSASSPTERMRITNDGSVWIGTTTGTIDSSNFGTNFGGDNRLDHSRDVADNATVAQFFGNLGRARIRGDGDLENTNNRYTGISDIKLKQNIEDASSQWDDIKGIKVRKYELIANPERKHIGVVAQELEEICPGLVIECIENEDTGETVKSVAYSVLYMKAVKALQEAMERIEQLEASNADLLARVTALEAS